MPVRFGYIPPWLDKYLVRREGVGTDPWVTGEPGTVLDRVHSTFSTTKRAPNSRPNSNPPPKLQVHLRRCDPTLSQPVLRRAGTTVPMYSCRSREITIAETQSHPRGANAKGVGLGDTILAIRLSVSTHRCCLASVPNVLDCEQGRPCPRVVVCFELQERAH